MVEENSLRFSVYEGALLLTEKVRLLHSIIRYLIISSSHPKLSFQTPKCSFWLLFLWMHDPLWFAFNLHVPSILFLHLSEKVNEWLCRKHAILTSYSVIHMLSWLLSCSYHFLIRIQSRAYICSTSKSTRDTGHSLLAKSTMIQFLMAMYHCTIVNHPKIIVMLSTSIYI